ncbi:MAG: hypothetical protein GWN87_19145, partial [Desulfuromonadales bacterium]|nr:hypothetical protein [Desulfuromonadales bacterium]
MLTRRIAALATLFLLLHFASAAATSAVPEDIIDDFKPLSGYVVKPIQGKYLIDLDASQGLAVGDLVSVVAPGEKIIHPVSGEVLGNLDEVKAVLRVSRIKDGYSYADPVGESAAIEAGDVVRRYEQVPAYFRDHTDDGEPIFAGLKTALPALEWQGYAVAGNDNAASPVQDAPALLFVLKAGKLEVRDGSGRVIHAYAVPFDGDADVPLAGIQATPAQGTVPPSSSVIERGRVKSKAIVHREAPSAEGLWISNNLRGIVVGVAVADFDGDDRMEIATLFGDRVEVAEKRDGEYQREAVIELGVGPKPLAVDCA